MQTVVSRVAAGAALVVVARMVSAREMAVWAVVSGFSGLTWTLADFGMAASLVRGSTDPDPKAYSQAGGAQILWVLLFAATLLAGRSALLRWIAWGPEVPALLVGVLAGMVLRGFATPARAWLERHMRFTTLAAIDTTSSLAQSAVLVGGLVGHLGVWSFALSSVAGDAVGLVATRLLGGSRMPLPSLGLSAIRQQISFGLALQLNNLAHLARESLTPILLAQLLGPNVAGLWAWVRKLLEVIYSFLNIGWRVSFPAYARLGSHHTWGKVSKSVLEVTFWPLLLSTVAIVGAGPWPLDAVFGTQWRSAHSAFYLALFGLVYSGPISVALAGAVLADGGAIKIGAAQVLRTLVLWTVALWMGPRWGVVAVAVGWFLQSMGDALTLLVFARNWRPSIRWMTRGLISGVIAIVIAGAGRAGQISAPYSVLGGLLGALVVVALNVGSLVEALRVARGMISGQPRITEAA